jgi:hypothetical protein
MGPFWKGGSYDASSDEVKNRERGFHIVDSWIAARTSAFWSVVGTKSPLAALPDHCKLESTSRVSATFRQTDYFPVRRATSTRSLLSGLPSPPGEG